MLKIIDKRESLADLISPRQDLAKPIYNWHSFKHSYSKALVSNLLKEFRVKKGSWVMDPFCGGGTTLLACKDFKVNSRGFDILPFSVFLSNVKTRNYDVNDLAIAKHKFVRYRPPTSEFPALADISIARKAFSPIVRDELVQIKQQIEEIGDPKVRDFYNLGMLSILESVSNTTKAGGFLRIKKQRALRGKTKEAFISRIDSMISDVKTVAQNGARNDISVSAAHGDARKIPSQRLFDAVITSPPYPNRHDYTRIYALELLFDFVKSNADIKKIRYETLRSHVEARKKYDATGYVQTKTLKTLISKVEKNGMNNPMVAGMLEGYFEDMFLAIKEMGKRVSPKGKVALVVSNVRFAGVNIPVDEILSEAGAQAGLRPKAIWLARYRGNSAQQMGAYSRQPSRESIVIWEK